LQLDHRNENRLGEEEDYAGDKKSGELVILVIKEKEGRGGPSTMGKEKYRHTRSVKGRGRLLSPEKKRGELL